MEACKISSVAQTPANRDLFDLREEQPLLSENEQKEMRCIVYQLLYLCNRVIPEALLAVNFLCTRVTPNDRNKLNRLLQYINGRKDVGITLSCDQDIHVFIYADVTPYEVSEEIEVAVCFVNDELCLPRREALKHID
jgi:hypothetical protein